MSGHQYPPKPLSFVLDGAMLDAISFISAVLGESYARSTPEGTFWWTATAAPGEVAVVVHKDPHSLNFALPRKSPGDFADNVRAFPDLLKRYAVLGYVQHHGLA